MKLTTFDFNEAPVRALLDEAGEPWFVAADVCRVLEIQNSRDAVGSLDEDDVATTDIIDSMGRPQRANTVSEAGLYQLVFASRKAEAKAFKRWVTKEVLPAIRKTGRYEAATLPAITSAEETAVLGVIGEVEQAIRDKRAGRLSNADAAILANLTSQYLKGWDIVLRLRTKSATPALPAKSDE